MGKTTRNYLNPYSAVLEKTRKKEKTGHFLRGCCLGVTPQYSGAATGDLQGIKCPFMVQGFKAGPDRSSILGKYLNVCCLSNLV